MIHSRAMGESFGLAIAEFLYHDKPVIACPFGNDQNHVKMLGAKGLWYQDSMGLYEQITSITQQDRKGIYRALVDKYTPENVMKKFNQVFIEGTQE